MEPAGQDETGAGWPVADGVYIPELRFLRPDRAEYGILCADVGVEPTSCGWGAVLYRVADGTQFCRLTSDMGYMNELGEAESAGVPFRFGDLELGRFQYLRRGWPVGWERPPGRIRTGAAVVLFYAEFALLLSVAFRAAGVSLFFVPVLGLRLTVRVAAISLGIAVLAGLSYLVFPLMARPSGLIGAAANWDQEVVRRRLWALLGVVIGLGGLGGLAVTHVLTRSDRQVLAGSAIGALLAAIGWIARVIGRRRSLGQEAVALLRRARRTATTTLDDRELARLEVLLTATWVPGSRTSWMTAPTARIFAAELGKSEEARSRHLTPCLKRTLNWVENGSGLVGTFHARVGIAGEFSSLPDQYPSLALVMRMSARLTRWRPRYYKRAAAARYAVQHESRSNGDTSVSQDTGPAAAGAQRPPRSGQSPKPEPPVFW